MNISISNQEFLGSIFPSRTIRSLRLSDEIKLVAFLKTKGNDAELEEFLVEYLRTIKNAPDTQETVFVIGAQVRNSLRKSGCDNKAHARFLTRFKEKSSNTVHKLFADGFAGLPFTIAPSQGQAETKQERTIEKKSTPKPKRASSTPKPSADKMTVTSSFKIAEIA